MLFIISYTVAAAFGLAYALHAFLHMCRSMNNPVPLQPPTTTTGVKRKHHKRRRARAAAKSQTSDDSKSISVTGDLPFSDSSQETLVDGDYMKNTSADDEGRPESKPERPRSLPRRMTSMCRKNATLCYFSIPLANVVKKGEDQDASIVHPPSDNLQEEEAGELKSPKPPARRQNSSPVSTFSEMMKNKKIVPGLTPVTRTTKLALARTAPTLRRTLTPFQGLRR